MTRYTIANLFVSAGITLAALLLIIGAVGAKASAPLHTETPVTSPAASNKAITSMFALPRVITTVQFPLGFNYAPGVIGVNPNTGYVYGGNEFGLSIISGTQFVANLAIAINAIGVNPSTGYVYIGNGSNLMVLSGTQAITSLAVASARSNIGVNPNTGYVYVPDLNLLNGNVTVVSGTEIITSLATGGWFGTVGVNTASGYIYLPQYWQDSVTIISGTEIITTVNMGASPRTAIANPNTGYTYVARSYDVAVFSGTEVITIVSTGTQPNSMGIDPGTGYVYVGNELSNDVSVLSGTQVVATLVMSGSPKDISANPKTGYVYVAHSAGITVLSGTQVISSGITSDFSGRVEVNPSTGYAYAIAGNPGNMIVVSGTEVIATLTAGFRPSLARVNPGTGYAYVEGTQNQKTYEMVILSQTQIVSRFTLYDLPSYEPGSCVYINIDPDTGYTYVATCHSNNVTILLGTRIIDSIPLNESPFRVSTNPRTGYRYRLDTEGTNYFVTVLIGTQVITTIPVPYSPWYGTWFIAVNSNTGYIYVVTSPNPFWDEPAPGEVLVISGTQEIARPTTGIRPVGISINPTTGYIYIPNTGSNEVTVLSGTEVITRLAIGSPQIVRVNPNTGYVYVASGISHTLGIISGTQVVTTHALPTGSLPPVERPSDVDVDLNPASGYAYVLNSCCNNVIVLSGTDIVGTIEVGDWPRSIATNPAAGLTYVTNLYSHSISIIQDMVVPRSLTPYVLFAPDEEIAISFGEPVITTSLQLEISPTLPFTVTWSPAADLVTISHDPLAIGTRYTLHVLPGGQATSGLGVAEWWFDYAYYPFHFFLPLIGK